MKKTIILLLVLISLVILLVRFSGKGTELLLGIKQQSGLAILSMPDGAQVSIDGNKVGQTPFEDKSLEPKEYSIRIEKDQALWQAKVRLTAGTVTVLNRELSKDPASSAGEVLSLTYGKGLTVISNPKESEVEVNGKSYGKTPLTISLEASEHTITVSHPNYLKRSIQARLPENYNLVVSVDLAISEADLASIPTPVITTTEELVVKETPTGFLRVRDKPSLLGKEIARLKPGDTPVLLEEQSGWDRVRLSDGTEGYVSSSYVEKKSQ